MTHLPLWLKIFTVFMAFVLIAPVLIVVISSFTASNFVTFPPRGLSLRWFSKVLTDQEFLRPLWNSVQLALTATALALALAIPAALTLVRHGGRWNAAVEAMILSPLALPTIILATGLLFFTARIGLANSWIGLVAGHVIVILPYCFRTVYGTYLRCNPETEEAARVLGARSWQVFLFVTLPAIRSGVSAGAIFGCLVSFDEVAIALLMTTPGTVTLPVSVLSYLVYNYDPSVAAISTVQIVIIVAALLVLEKTFGLNRIMFPEARK